MERQLEWFSGRPDEYQIRELQGRALAFAGRRQEASRSFAQAAALADARGLKAEKARILGNETNLSATFGMTNLAETQARALMAALEKEGISPEEVQPFLIGQLDSQPLAWTLALCGDSTQAQSLAEDFAKRFPLDTIYNSVWLPLIRSTLELKRGESSHLPAATDHAIQLLPPPRQYEPALNFRPTWMRGEAYLQAWQGRTGRGGVSKDN